MKLALQQLEAHLTKKLAPLYLVSGDETLLVQETLDLIRAAAQNQGFSERVRVPVENSDWGEALLTHSQSFSLFATKRVLDLDLSAAKLNAANTKLLLESVAQPSIDTILLIRLTKLDSKTEKTAWYQTLEKKGIAIPIWPVTIEYLPQWINARARKLKLTLTPKAAEMLATLVEGNLLAAAQELEKLVLLQDDVKKTIDEHMIENAVAEHAHFDIFALVDSVLAGKKNRALRILENLRAEDVEPPIILWALTRELRVLADLAQQSKQGGALSALFTKYRIWEKRQPLVRTFLQRHTQEKCWDFLAAAAQIDRMVKGADTGNVWDELSGLVVKML